ncbi:hypothetical protein GXW83_11340 [Streptacidiphilus sp. PB12-B1b]|nr:hypothetical protein GXW83_11340 [Streptacidiphilus sp. PB12-B1b]
MWEVRAAPGRLAELLAWVEQQLPAAVAGGAQADVYTAADDRIVVILRSPGGDDVADLAGDSGGGLGGDRPARLPDPPAELLARPPHQWPFGFHGHWSPRPDAASPDAD